MSLNKFDQQIAFSNDVRDRISKGINLLADAVSATLGSDGRNVMIFTAGNRPMLTKDGVTVAKSINPSDPFERMAVEVVKQASQQACIEAGDGTTTATVLSRAIYTEALKCITSASVNPVAMSRGINYASEELQRVLAEHSTPCDTLEQMIRVATISANSDKQVGKLVGEAIYNIGDNGYVSVSKCNAVDTRLEVTDGMVLNCGFTHPMHLTDTERQVIDLGPDTLVLLYCGKLETMEGVERIVNYTNEKRISLLIIAEDYDEGINQELSNFNRESRSHKRNYRVAVIKTPGYLQRRREIMRDLEVYLGARVSGPEGDIELSELALEDLGRAEHVLIERKVSMIRSTSGDVGNINARIGVLTEALTDPEISKFESESLQERIGTLSGKLATIHVGGLTDIEVGELKDRYDDAVCAVRSATQMGVLPGGGTALIAAAEIVRNAVHPEMSNDMLTGFNTVLNAVAQPCYYISKNAGVDGDGTVAKVRGNVTKDFNYGYNAATGVFGDMIEMGVIDPTKVTCSAIKYSASVAGALITTEVGIVN